MDLLCLFNFHFLLPYSAADTKRKVEQISEELKNLDEMLAGRDEADGSVEASDEEGTSPTPHDGSDQVDREGTCL